MTTRTINIAARSPQQLQVALRELLNRIADAEDLASGGIEVVQAAHGLSATNAVYGTGSGTYAKAIATAENTCAVGVVTSVADASTFRVSFAPAVLEWTHGFSLNVPLYLSQSVAGAWTATRPTSGWIQLLGRGLKVGEALWKPERPEFI